MFNTTINDRFINFLGLKFYYYGLLIGLALVIALQFWRWLLLRSLVRVSDKKALLNWFDQGGWLIVVVSAVFGARFWHLFTDWNLYIDQWNLALKLSNGGLSILGAMVGGWLGLLLSKRWRKWSEKQFNLVLDLSALSLAVGQVIGRMANLINQELYGWPTALPWGIFIERQYRPPELLQFTHFHPLAIYEMLLVFSWLVIIGRKLYRVELKNGRFNGLLLKKYLLYYLVARFFLDFLRINSKIVSFQVFSLMIQLGANQLLILIFLLIFSLIDIYSYLFSKNKRLCVRLP